MKTRKGETKVLPPMVAVMKALLPMVAVTKALLPMVAVMKVLLPMKVAMQQSYEMMSPQHEEGWEEDVYSLGEYEERVEEARRRSLAEEARRKRLDDENVEETKRRSLVQLQTEEAQRKHIEQENINKAIRESLKRPWEAVDEYEDANGVICLDGCV